MKNERYFMWKKIVLLGFLLMNFSLFAQSPVEKYSIALKQTLSKKEKDEKILAWIFFKDKGTYPSNKFYKADELISERALQRRAKVRSSNSLTDERDYPVCENYISMLEKLGVVVKQKSKWLNGVSAYLNENVLDKISELDFVKSVDLVAKFKKNYNVINSEVDDVKSLKSNNTQYTYNYGSSLTQIEQINVAAVHDLNITGSGVLIGVMDAGFSRLSHTVFQNLSIVDKWDFVNNDADVGDGSDMGEGSHGTQTLSCLGGFKSGQLIGTAFGASFLLAKTENTDSETPIEEDNWIAAIEWAEGYGVDVTSTSLGYIGFDAPYVGYTWESMDGDTPRITAAADQAAQNGVVVVNSAGNEGSAFGHNTLGAPSDGDSVIAVGAVNSSGNRASFSSVGNTVDGRIKPDVMAMGVSVRVASPWSDNGYTNSDGTSFSCPLAAGVAALILQAHPTLTPMEVREAMRQTSSNVDAPNNMMGWGILDALAAINYYTTPVELLSFNAALSNDAVVLNWQTATELNNSGFEILRSENNSAWNKIGFVTGAGSSTELQSYDFKDNSVLKGRTYFYKLKQIDFDGAYNFSNVTEIALANPSNYFIFNNYPNPFNPETTIKYSIAERAIVNISLFDILGKKVRDVLNEFKETGEYEIGLDASDLPSGIYIVRLQTKNYTGSIKINLIK
ncbi:MAG: S8/S53 family peptidase [bacterium]